MLQLKRILAGSVIAYGTGVILWVAYTFTQALITEHVRVDLTIHSFALVILLVFFGASSVAIGMLWYQHHHKWVFRIVMAQTVAIIIAAVCAVAVVDSSSLITSLIFLVLFNVPPLAVGTYLLKPVR